MKIKPNENMSSSLAKSENSGYIDTGSNSLEENFLPFAKPYIRVERRDALRAANYQ